MSYFFYITRKADWSDGDGPEIGGDEWLSCVTMDKSLELDREQAAKDDPKVASGTKEPTHALWKEWAGRGTDGREAWMWLEKGNVVCADADQGVRRKLFLIADYLDARLQGDNGEFFDSSGNVVTGRSITTKNGRRKPWWKFW